jgi:predicted hydrocarbon binding protein
MKLKIPLFEKLKSGMQLKAYVEGKVKAIDCLKFEEGRLKLFEIDSCILFLKSWGLLMKGLIDMHGPAIITTMKEAHKKDGIEEMNEIKRIVPKEKLGKIFSLWMDLGWVEKVLEAKIGRDENLRDISIEKAFSEIREDDNKLIVRVKGSASSRAMKFVMKKSKFPACVYEPSYVAGAIEAFTGRKCEVEETKCEAKGDKYCEWVFTLE